MFPQKNSENDKRIANSRLNSEGYSPALVSNLSVVVRTDVAGARENASGGGQLS